MDTRLPNRTLDTLDTLFQTVVARGRRKSGDGDIGLSEGLASDWRVNNFDLLRLLAALQVAVVHSSGFLKPTSYFARLLVAGLDRFPGVPIFFVISGVLISKSYEHSDSLLEFYIVLPALYGVLRLRRHLGNMRLLAIALASLAVQLLIVNSHRSVGQVHAYSLLKMTLAPYLWMFLVGVAIQRNWSTVRGWLFGRAHAVSDG
jgi:peptidoglycan/LPS O-acetylase OafA/YrhL